jgi:glycosyltransferase involved in cell wall biosynthesis
LRAAPIDILIQDELNHPSLFALNHRLRRTIRYPIVTLVHHLRCYEAQPVIRNWLYRRIEQWYLSSVDGFICNSETTRQAVCDTLRRASLPQSIVAYPAGDRFNATITDEQIAMRAHEAGALRIVFVGNLIPRKGLHTLLDALARWPSDTWQLTVVGNPHADERYTRTIHTQIARQRLTHVHLVGVLADELLAATLRQAQVLAVPSEYEGFGIVYLEGMSFGLPVIATTRGAAHELITEGENGYLVVPGDATTLAARLAELQRDRTRLAQLSLAAYARFLAQPHWHDSMAHIRGKLREWVN